MQNKIYLATTKGCYACKVMTNILTDIVSERTDITPIVVDFQDLPTFIKINVPLHDFPILIFVDDKDVIKYHINGTITKNKLKRIINEIDF